MAHDTIPNFAGERPIADPSKLQAYEAQTAIDCRLRSGNLQAFKSLLAVDKPASATTPKTIHRWAQTAEAIKTGKITAVSLTNPVVITSAGHGLANGDRVFLSEVVGTTQVNDAMFLVAQATANTFALQGIDGTAYTAYVSGGVWAKANGYLFEWAADVSVASAQLLDDTHHTVVYSGDGNPKITDDTLATNGAAPYPSASYDLGVPSPATAPIVAVQDKTGNITGATQANPVVITSAGHGLSTGDTVGIASMVGMTSLNGNSYSITYIDANHFSLNGVDGTGFSAYTSGGTWTASFDPSVVESVAYVRTWVSQWATQAFESAPSVPSAVVDIGPGQPVALSGLGSPPTGAFTITAQRIYRGVSDPTNPTNVQWLFVAELGPAATTYTDTTLDSSLGSPLESEGWAEPPSDLAGVVSVPNGMIAGFRSGSPTTACFSVPRQPQAWPVEYRHTTPHPIVGMGSYDNTVVACTTDAPVLFTGTAPQSITAERVQVNEGCTSAHGIVSLKGVGVVYPSPQGLCLIGPGGFRVVTDKLISPTQWRALNPWSIRAFAWEGRYFAFYDNGTTKAGFVFDPHDPESTWTELSWYPDAMCQDTTNGVLQLLIGGVVYTFDRGDGLQSFTWWSREFAFARPVMLNVFRVTAKSYANLSVAVYGDGVLRATVAVTSSAVQRFSNGQHGRARSWSFKLTGTDDVVRLEAATTPSELAATR